MRPLTMALLVACLLAAGTDGQGAEPLSNEEAAVRIVLVPEAGISVAFPPYWRTGPSRFESRGPLTTLREVTNLRVQQHCAIDLFEGLTLSEAVDLNSANRLPEIVVFERSALTLPVGDAERLFWRYGDHEVFAYYVAVPAGTLNIACTGDAPPADRWLSIVESIAVIEDEVAPTPTYDPRVAVPEHGFAIDFPVEWFVQASAKPTGLMFGGDSVLWAARGDPLTEPADVNDCWLDDNTEVPGARDLSLDGWLEAIGEAARVSGPLAVEPVSTRVDLPSGPSGHVDWIWDGYPPRTAWMFVEGERRLLLSCMADDPPEDRWRSIAETFEFLPAEE